MGNSQKFFKEIQFFYISIIPILVILFILSFLFFSEIGSKKLTLYPYLFATGLFLFILLNTYKLQIIITANFLTISFGIGLINKKIPLNQINKSSIDFIDIPWYYGIGIRMNRHMTIYNTKPGKAILLKNFINNKSYAIVSRQFKRMKEILKQN